MKACFIPKKGVDDIIGAKLLELDPTSNLWNMYTVAALRGAYSEVNKTPLDLEDVNTDPAKLESVVKELVSFIHKEKQKNAKFVSSLSHTSGQKMFQLSKAFSGKEMFNRTNMIVNGVLSMVNKIQTQNPTLSTAQILTGIKVNDKKEYGLTLLLEALYNNFNAGVTALRNKGEKEKAEKIEKVLQNWSSFLPFIKAELSDYTNLNIAGNADVAVDAEVENLVEDVDWEQSVEELPKESFAVKKHEMSPFKTANEIVRMTLKLMPKKIQKMTPQGETIIENEVDDLGITINMNPAEIYLSLIELVSLASTDTLIRDVLYNAYTNQNYYWLEPIINELFIPTNFNDTTVYTPQLISVFKRRLAFRSALFNSRAHYEHIGGATKTMTEQGTIKRKTLILNKIENTVLKSTQANLAMGNQTHPTKSVYNSDKTTNILNIKDFVETVETLFSVPKTEEKNANLFNSQGLKNVSAFDNQYTKNRAAQAHTILDLAHRLGIPMSLEVATKIVFDTKKRNSIIKAFQNLAEYGFKARINNNVIKADTKYINVANTFYAEERLKNLKTTIINENYAKIANIVSDVNAHNKYENSARRKNSKNLSVRLFGYLKPSFLSKFVNNIKKFINVDDTNGLKKYFLDNYGQSSVFIEKFANGSYRWLNTYIKDLLFPQDSFSENDFASKLAIKRFVGQDGLDSADYTPLERALNHIEEFSFAENDENYAWYPVFTLGDSEVTKYIKAKIYTEDEIINGLYLTYLSEHRKWKVLEKAREKMEKENIAPLKLAFKNIGVYTLLQFLNDDYVAPNGQTNVYSQIAKSGSEQDVKKAIKLHLRDSFIVTQQTYQQLGVYNKVVDMLGNATNMYLHINHLGENIDKINEVLYKQHINTKFSLTQLLQLFHTDPAFYKGSKDLQKRNKQVITGSDPLNLNAVDSNGELICPTGTLNVKYIEDYISDSEIDNPAFAAAVKHNLGNTTAPASYKENNATDGGGFRTLDSYRMIRRLASKWTEEDEMAYSIIKNIVSKYDENTEMSEDDVIAVLELSQVFQALKPFYFGHEFYAIDANEKLMIGVQHKYAETLLIPQLLPIGSKLRTVGFAMENHVDKEGNPQPIDLVLFGSGVKTGEFGAVNLDYKTGTQEPADVDDIKSLFNTFGYVHQLSLDNYMLVTNVPVHNDTAHANFATQIRKLVMAGVNKTKDYSHYMKGKIPLLYRGSKKSSFNGEDLINFYNELILANMVETFNEVNTLLQDKSKLSEAFISNVINNARESKDNILAYSLWEINGDVKFLMPLFGGMLSHDAQAALLSIYKKKVNKQKIQGGSYVQASAWGINKVGKSTALQIITNADFTTDAQGNKIIDPSTATNVLYTECQIPFELSYKKPNGEVVNLVQSDWCNADGTLKLDTKNEIKKDDPRYKDYQSFIDAEGKVRQPLIDKQFPGILDFVAYRIPTEGSYSMLKLKAVRFSTKIEGGIIKVPFEGTTIAGFDFDIDKLFFMRKEFMQKNLTKDQVRDIWQGIYKEHPEIKQALLDAKSDAIKGEALVSKIFHIFNNSDLAEGIVNLESEVKSLNKYWAEAGLEGTAKQVFDDYIKLHPYKYMSFEEYNNDVLPMYNKKAVRNNALLEIIQNRLQDPETFNARFTPGGFPNASNAARMLREIIFSNPSDITENGVISFNKIQTRAKDKSLDPEPNYDPTLLTTILLYDELNSIASKLIGVFANHNTNHSLAGMMDEFSLLNPILFGEMVGAVFNILANGARHNVGQGLLGKKITLSNGQEIFIDTTMAEFLAAAVDAVKDPVLNYLNLNTVTANAGALLGRLGYSFLDIGLLLNQPVIKEICREVLNNNITIEQAAVVVGDKYAKIFNNQKYLEISLEFLYNKEKPQFYTTQELGQSILEHRLKTEKQESISKNMAEQQLRVLGLFLTVLTNASALNDFVVNTKFTSENAVKSTMGGMYNQQQKLELYAEQLSKSGNLLRVKVNNKVALPMLPSRVFDNYATATEEFLELFAGHPFAYEQMMAVLNYKFMKSLGKIFPYETAFFKGVRESTQLLMNKAVPANVIDRAHEKAVEYLLKIQENSLFNPETTIDRITGKGANVNNTSKENIKPEILKLFSDKPELANQVYEVLGLSNSLSLKDVLNEYTLDELKGGVTLKSLQNKIEEKDFETIKRAYNYLKSQEKYRSIRDSNEQIESKLKELREKLRQTKETGVGSVLTITNDDNVSEYKVKVLEINRYGDYAILKVKTAKNKEYTIKVDSLGNTKTGYIEDFVFKSTNAENAENIKLEINNLKSQLQELKPDYSDYYVDYFENSAQKVSITHEQKQLAQQKFQEYVNATGKQDIEGFKKFLNIERMTTKEYYLNRFPQIFLETVSKSDELKKFDIILAIVPEVREGDVEKLDLIVPQIGNLDKKHGIDILKSSWKDLHSRPEFRSLSFDLFFYNFYKVGFSFNPQGFMTLVPTEVELDLQLKSLDLDNNISYVEFLNRILDGEQHLFTNPSNFLKYFVVNNLDLGIFTYKASGDIKKVLKDKMFVGPAKDILVESITISKKELLDQKFDFEKIFFDTVGEGENTYVKTKPIIQVDNTYFVANNIKSEERGRLFNYVKEEGGDVVARYSRIDISSLTLATKEALLPTEELVEISGNKNVLKKLTLVELDRFDKYKEALQAIFKKDTIFDISGMEGQLKLIFINSLANKSSEYEMQSALIQKVLEILANNKETIVMDSEGERTSSC